MRNTPDAHAFIDKASREGVGAATNERDAAFDDCDVAGPEHRPDSDHAIEPSGR